MIHFGALAVASAMGVSSPVTSYAATSAGNQHGAAVALVTAEDAAVTEVWNAFVAALRAGDTKAHGELFCSEKRDVYKTLPARAKDGMVRFANSITGFYLDETAGPPDRRFVRAYYTVDKGEGNFVGELTFLGVNNKFCIYII